MRENDREILRIETDLQNDISSYKRLCKLAYDVQITGAVKITIDMHNVRFVASNLFAVLGCIFDSFYQRDMSDASVYLSGIKNNVKEHLRKNGFCRHLGLEKIPDIYNTVIPYKIFKVEEIDEYERYLTISLFGRKDLPKMSPEVSDIFRDSLLELFKNVKDHTSSKKIFTCGQYFPKTNILYFTIVDAGETIPYNVKWYHEKYQLPIPVNTVKWATMQGNTTLAERTPRGIGLSLIKDFVSLNGGCFYIISGIEVFEITSKGESCKNTEYPFPGTIVTIGFNLNDKATYFINNEYNPIQF